MPTAKTIAAMLIATAAAAGAVSSATASTFAAWSVTNVPWGDTLNARKYPASYSQKQTAYPNGAVLSMTGRCTDGVNLFNIAHLSTSKQKQIVRYRWCEVWHDPARDGNFTTGWVYGRYIRPM